MLFIGRIREQLTLVSLTGGENAEALAQAAALGTADSRSATSVMLDATSADVPAPLDRTPRRRLD